MDTLNIVTLSLLMISLASLPSASVALVVTRSATHGISNGIAVSIGIVLGDLTFLSLAYLGMSILVETMGAFFAVIKYLGGAYLVWLGIRLLLSNTKKTLKTKTNKKSLATSLLSGFFLTLGDIKAILFYASILPTFTNLESYGFGSLFVLASITITTVGGVKVAYAFIAGRLVDKIASSKSQKFAKSVSGCLLIGSGTYLISKA